MRNLPVISIVILNWNSVQDTLELLASIYKSDYPKSKYEVIVVDNGSTDGSVKKIKRTYNKVRIISLKQNIGVSARNKGFRIARGEIIVTLDSDAIIDTNTLSAIAKKLRDDSSIGILGVKILNKKTLIPEFSPMHVNFFTGTISTLNPFTATTNATFLPFICLAIQKKTLKKVGLLNPNFFFYGEDFDLCMRSKKNGIKIYYYPLAHAYHGKSKTTSDIPHKIKYHHYYKGLFLNVFQYGNTIQIISTSIFQLVLIPFYRLFFRSENTFFSRFVGFWWAISNQTKIFLLIFLLGIALRIAAINQRDFWFDEAFTYHIARLPLNQLFNAVLTDNNPPFYYLIVHFVLKFGSSETLLRIPSIVFNIAVMFLLYTTVSWYRSRKAGLIAVLLFSVSPLALYIATEARLHSLTMLMAVLLTSLFLKLIKNGKPLSILLFILTASLGLYTQYYIALLFLPFTWIVLRNKTSIALKNWIFIAVSALVTLIPWLFFSARTSHNGCSCTSTFLSLPASLVSPALGGVGEVTLRLFPALPLPILFLFGTTAFITLFLLLKGLMQNRLITLLYFVPLGTLSFLGLFLPVFSPKAFAIFSPFYFAIVALGITSYSYRKSGVITLLLTVLLITISIIQITNPFFAGSRLKLLNTVIQKNQAVPVAHTSLLTYYSLNYYSQGKQKHILITQNPLVETLKFIGGHKQEVDPKLDNLWLVDTIKWVDKAEHEQVLKQLYKYYEIEKNYKVDRISVSLLKRK